MSTSLGPLYVKHSVLGATRHDTLLAYRLCISVNAVIPGHVRGHARSEVSGKSRPKQLLPAIDFSRMVSYSTKTHHAA